MGLDGVWLPEIDYRAPESLEQDQIAHMCKLILFYTFRKLMDGHKMQNKG